MSLGSLGDGLKFLFACVALCASPIETANENLPQFKVFCSIYKLIKDPERQVKLLDNETRVSPGRIIREMEKLVLVTSPPSDETEMRNLMEKEEPNWSLEEMDNGHGRRVRRYEALVAGETPVKLANKKIKRILETATKIYNKFKDEERNLQGLEDGIKKKLKKALSGNDEGTIDDKSFGGSPGSKSRQDSCSKDASANGPGKSLVNDIFCLCGDKYTDNGSPKASDACGSQVGDHANWGAVSNADNNLPAGAKNTFPKIMDACPGDKEDRVVQLGDIHRAVGDFDALLGKTQRVASVTDWHNYHFGQGHTATADGTCKGTNDNHYMVCVNYMKALTGTGTGIAWRSSLLEAEKSLQEANRVAEDLRRMDGRLESLREMAWSDYEDAASASANAQTDSTKSKPHGAVSQHGDSGNATTKAILAEGSNGAVTERHARQMAKIALLFSIILA